MGVIYFPFILIYQMLCCSHSVSCIWNFSGGFWMCLYFCTGVSSEAFIQRSL